MSRPKLATDVHRARGTLQPCRHGEPAAATPNEISRRREDSTPPPEPPEPLESLGEAGARIWAWCWQTWADVLTADDALTITNLARLADTAADMDALYAEAEPGKRAMAGRLRVSARFRFTAELARLTARVEKYRED